MDYKVALRTIKGAYDFLESEESLEKIEAEDYVNLIGTVLFGLSWLQELIGMEMSAEEGKKVGITRTIHLMEQVLDEDSN